MVNPGELKHKLSIVKVKLVVNEQGAEEENAETIYTLRAKKKTVSTKENMSSEQANSKLVLKFITRKRKFDSDMVAVFEENNIRYFMNIKHIHEFEDDKYIEMTCEEDVRYQVNAK